MENNSQSNKLYYFYLTGVILILALPLLAFAPIFHPPAWGKTIIFRIIFSILFFVLICQILLKRFDNTYGAIVPYVLSRKSRIFWPFWFLVSILNIYFLATIFSLEPHFSFWGSPYRSGGFLNFAFCVFFALFLFLIIKHKDWIKIWDFSIFIGILVAFLGIAQKFNWFSNHLLPYQDRPVSTMGGPMFLATYLMLLSIIALSFGIIAKSKKKKFFYFFSFLLFLSVIILTATRSAFLGIIVGIIFFIFFFPKNNIKKKKLLWLKIITGIILILAVFGVFWLKEKPEIIKNLNQVLGPPFARTWSIVGEFSIQSIFQSRGDGWKVALEAFKNRPILGYGPENFSIAFDKYYDSSLPGITRGPGGAGSSSWWDRAHNFLLDISLTAGIPALIIYLALFGVLFWQLQRIKIAKLRETERETTPIIIHGIQATFIAYLVNNLFNFDIFSTYLISFLLIGYSLHLIKTNETTENLNRETTQNETRNYAKTKPWKYVIIFLLFFFLIFFIINYNLKPLQINKEINEAILLSSYEKNCDSAINKMEKIVESKSILDNYLRLQYIDIISQCLNNYPQYRLGLSQKAIKLLEESVKSRPYYTRSWEFIGLYSTKIINMAKEQSTEIDAQTQKDLINKAYAAFGKARELSPARQKTFIDIAELDIILEKFDQAKENSDKCIALNPGWANCYWTKALIEINLDNTEEADKNMEIAKEKGYPVNDKNSLGELINVYSKLAKKTNDLKYYQKLVELYQKLIDYEPKNPKYRASLAYVYKEMKNYQEAKKQALIVLELAPELKDTVEKFLKTLPD